MTLPPPGARGGSPRGLLPAVAPREGPGARREMHEQRKRGGPDQRHDTVADRPPLGKRDPAEALPGEERERPTRGAEQRARRGPAREPGEAVAGERRELRPE